MNLFQERPSGKSIAAFMFLPQFRLMLPQFALVQGIFVSLLASMFTQAGLLPWNHPATKVGLQNKFRIRDLIGEAWVNLRTSDATPYQYAMFGSVILMLAFLVLMIVTALVTFLFSATAHAQPIGPLFSHPPSATDDLANNMLDGVLGLASRGAGNAAQNALGPLLAMYSWAVLVVGAFMVFWAVISVVAETARTGQLGGNRHNMLWSPIRLVFAIGLLVPLGYGFNSGQYIVIKIAEWGSNLASRGWETYIDALLNQDELLSKSSPLFPAAQARDLLAIMVCKYAYNKQIEEGYRLTSAAAMMIQEFPRISIDMGVYGKTFGNLAQVDICGVIKYSDPDDPTIFPLVKDEISALRTAQQTNFDNIKTAFEDIGCGIATKTLAYSAGCGGSGGWDGNYPDTAQIIAPLQAYATGMSSALASARAGVLAKLKDPSIKANLTKWGWAGAGAWYHYVAGINKAYQDAAVAFPTITGPKVAAASNNEQSNSVSAWASYLGSFVGVGNYGYHTKTQEALIAFDQWWGNAIYKVPSPSLQGLDEVRGGTGMVMNQKPGGGLAGNAMGSWAATDYVWELLKSFFGSGGQFFLYNIDNDTYPLAELARIGHSLITKSLWAFGGIGVLALATSYFVPGVFSGPVGSLLSLLGTAGFSAGVTLLYMVPMLPFIRMMFAVLAWLISVMEAVVMMPLFALVHLRTDGEGLPGPMAQGGYIILLGLLFRPILIIIGFVSSLLLFTEIVRFLNKTLAETVKQIAGTDNLGIIADIAFSVIYVGLIYVLANSTFKLVDVFPSAISKWIGGPADGNTDESGAVSEFLGTAAGSMVGAASNASQGLMSAASDSKRKRDESKNNPKKPGVTEGQ